MKEYDVVIAGGGPAGLSAAMEIDKCEDIRSLILEKGKINVSKKSICVWKHQLKDWDVEDCIDNEPRLISIGSSVSNEFSIHKGVMAVLNVNKMLEKFSKRIKKCEVKQNTRLNSFYYVGDGLILKTTRGKIKTKLLIDAAGYKSPAVKKFGLQKDNFFYQCFVVDCKVSEYDKMNVQLLWEIIDWKKKENFWIEAHSKNSISIGVMTVRKKRCSYGYLKSRIFEYIKKKKIKCTPCDYKWGVLPMYNFEKTYFNRVLLAGDSASQVLPSSGYGCAAALRNGRLAGKTCIRALREGDYSEKYLKFYSKAWKHSVICKYDLNAIFLLIQSRMTASETEAYIKLVQQLDNRSYREALTGSGRPSLLLIEFYLFLKEFPILNVIKRLKVKDYLKLFALTLRLVKDSFYETYHNLMGTNWLK